MMASGILKSSKILGTTPPATGGSVSDATTSTKGIVQLAGDLGGTAAAPTVPGLATANTNIATNATAIGTANTNITANTNSIAKLSNALIFGDGSDGAVTFDGTTTVLGLVPAANVYTLTRDVMATTLVVNSGVTIKVAGYRIFASTSINNAGTIAFDGNAGNANGTAGTATQQVTTTAAGGAGATGVGTAASAGEFGAAGGAGGAGGTGGAGASGSLTTSAAQAQMFARTPYVILSGGFNWAGTKAIVGGGGGGGGGGDGTNKGGGGGAGGGPLILVSPSVTNSGTLSAKGGNGGTPTTGNAGGGGGGGGGSIIIYSKTAWTNSGTTTVTAGTGGSLVGTGNNGATGSAGFVLNTIIA